MNRTGCFLAILISGCVSQGTPHVPVPAFAAGEVAREEFKAGEVIEFDAYALYYGELNLFDSKEAAELNLVYPYCISANSHDLDSDQKRAFDRRWVRVVGTLLKKDHFPPDPGVIRTMSSADGMGFKNWCYGPHLLRIEEIEVSDQETDNGN